jgi:predicted Zn-dependent peptidase
MGERRLVVHKFAQLPILMIGYHVPQTNSKDYYALEILRTIISSGESSRLYQRLVDKDQTALDVEVDVSPALDPTLLVVTAQPKQDVDPQKVEKAVYEEMERIKTAGVTDRELEKAKNIELARFYHEMQTINARANTIGTYEVFFGDYHKLFEAAKNYAAVTKEDVQRAARTYFGEKNRTAATLVPESEEKDKR